jgi:hypothetical protein
MNRHSRTRFHRQLDAYLAFWREVERKPQAAQEQREPESWDGQPWKEKTTR